MIISKSRGKSRNKTLTTKQNCKRIRKFSVDLVFFHQFRFQLKILEDFGQKFKNGDK